MRRHRAGAAIALVACGAIAIASLASATPHSRVATPPKPKKGRHSVAPKPHAPPPLPKCTIKGTRGPDFLHGTRKADVICGLGGNDHIWAGPNDVVLGGRGNDTIYARNGRPNPIFGTSGFDRARVDAQIDFLNSVERLLP